MNTQNKLIKIIKDYWQYIAFFCFAIIIVLINSNWGYSILANDNYSPELNPVVSFFRYLISPAWRGYRGLGIASETEQADLFRSLILFLLNTFLDTKYIGFLYYILMALLGSFSLGKISEYVIHKIDLKEYKQIAFITASVIYLTTLWTVWINYQSFAPYGASFGLTPLIIWLSLKYINDRKVSNLIKVFVFSLLFNSVGVISTLAITNLVFIFTIIPILLGKNFFKYFRYYLITVGVILSTQLFWMLPFFIFVLYSSNGILSSSINRLITTSVIDLERQTQTSANSLRFFTRILTDNRNGIDTFQMGKNYLTVEILKVLSFVPFSLAVVALLNSLTKIKRNFQILLLFLLMMTVWIVIKVDNPPLGNIFSFLQNNLPLFNQVLRWPISKVGTLFLIVLSILSSVGFVYFIDLFNSFIKSKLISNILIYSLLAILLIAQFQYANFLFNGLLFSKQSKVQIPDSYFALNDYLVQNNIYNRIYYFPPSNNNYFRETNWGFYGSQFISYILPNPIIDRSNAVGSLDGENAIDKLEYAIRNNDKNSFENLLKLYDINYILYDSSIKLEGFEYDLNKDDIENLLNKFENKFSKDNLKLYSLESDNSSLIETQNNDNSIGFERNNPQNPNIYLLNPGEFEYKVQKNSITTEFQFKGITQTYTLNVDNFDTYPTYYILKNNSIVANPAFPTFVDYSDIKNLPFREYKLEKDFDYFLIGNKVFSDSDLRNGITFENKYSDPEIIQGVNLFNQKVNLTSEFIAQKPFNCLNDENNSVKPSKEIGSNEVTIKSTNGEPCLLVGLSKAILGGYIEIEFDWESIDSQPGFCLYSNENKRCLNQDKYIVNTDKSGKFKYTFTNAPSTRDTLNLILYAKNDINPEVTFKNIVINYSNELTPIGYSTNQPVNKEVQILLTEGEKYTLSIPIIYGKNSYNYKPSDQFSLHQSVHAKDFEVKLVNELLQTSVTQGYLNLSQYLFKNENTSDYLLFWSGQNVENIPLSFCLNINNDKGCLHKGMMAAKSEYSSMNILRNVPTGDLGIILNSTSYKNESVNQIKDIIVMKLDSNWVDLYLKPETSLNYSELELSPLGSPLYSTFYFGRIDNSKNTIISIPQNKDNGWLAIYKEKDGNLKILSNNESVKINNWKQGWDISNSAAGNLFVLYWPNLLAYWGYLMIIFTTIYLTVLNFKKRKK